MQRTRERDLLLSGDSFGKKLNAIGAFVPVAPGDRVTER